MQGATSVMWLTVSVAFSVPVLAQSANEIDRYLPLPDLGALSARPGSEVASVVDRYSSDRAALARRWHVAYSPTRLNRFREFYRGWTDHLQALEFEGLSIEGKVDYVLVQTELRYALESLGREEALFKEMAPLIPFATTLIELQEARRRMEIPDPQATAALLADLPHRLAKTKEEVQARLGGTAAPSRIVAFRAADALSTMRGDMATWHAYYAGYDPLFTWWTKDPFEKFDEALGAYVDFLRAEVVGVVPGEDEPIVGDPIGAEGLRSDLAHEMIAYTPAELIAIAEREFEWLDQEMLRASRDLGYGDDWKAALEHVKNLAVEPGKQTVVVRDLAYEAVEFVTQRDLVTIPPLAEEMWRMEMMSPERQKVNPFFLGGEVIRVSYPTDEMAHEDKLMSMRGNNPHFSRATVHHELIPGHHLQGFMTSRYNSHRSLFRTPFWGEGWALYWEMLLWDLDFPQSPENRIGMLFWRSHRCARIIFSLSFHLEKMTAQEAIEFLIENVGHERNNVGIPVCRVVT